MKKIGFSSFSIYCLCALGGDSSLASCAEAASLAPVDLWFCTWGEIVPGRNSEVK